MTTDEINDIKNEIIIKIYSEMTIDEISKLYDKAINEERHESKSAQDEILDSFLSYAYINGLDFSFMGKIVDGKSDIPDRLNKIKKDFLNKNPNFKLVCSIEW